MVTQAAAQAEVPVGGTRTAVIVFQIAVVLALAAAGPLWLILVAPLVLGVPHVVADIRYLILRGPASLDARALLAIAVPLAVMTALRAAALAGGPVDPMLPMVDVALGAAAVIGAVVLAPIVRPWAAIAIIAVAAAAVLAPRLALLVLLHGHNAFAFVIWLGWAHGRVPPARRAAIVAAAIAGAVAIAAGAFDGVGGGATSSAPIAADALTRTLAPGLAGAAAARVVMLYAYAQALHYLVWLRVIPTSAAARPTLRAELGAAALVIAAVAAIAVPVAALACGAAQLRSIYLAVIAFHAWLELAIVAHLIVARARLVE